MYYLHYDKLYTQICLHDLYEGLQRVTRMRDENLFVFCTPCSGGRWVDWGGEDSILPKTIGSWDLHR